ncbi:MAG: 16S rRNA (adenine(1518)-N(6)/adenine(1519)-N(6))-dimethyltransferase RsmA [Bacteroidota bacterium]
MHNLKPKKYLGQHFLKDLHVARRIAETLDVPEGTDIVEIGPGEGVLTRLLLDVYPKVHVVEIDVDAVRLLRKTFLPEQVHIIHQDVLRWTPEGFDKVGLIGNLPYNISSPFFFQVIEYREKIHEGVFMIQKEVAERIASPHGNKTYGILSILMQTYFDVTYEFSVPPEVFRPPPKVVSGVLKIVPKTEVPEIPFSTLKRVVKQAFSQRRKTLRNALKGVSFEDFEEKEIWWKKRAEELSVEQFAHLAKHLLP